MITVIFVSATAILVVLLICLRSYLLTPVMSESESIANKVQSVTPPDEDGACTFSFSSESQLTGKEWSTFLNNGWEFVSCVPEEYNYHTGLTPDEKPIRKTRWHYTFYKTDSPTPLRRFSDEKILNKLKHALGMDNKDSKGGIYEAYRRSSSYDTPDEIWEGLRTEGLAKRLVDEDGKEFIYAVTDKGMQYVADQTGLTIRYTLQFSPKK